MMEPASIAAKIKEALADAQVQVQDLTGTKDHYRVTIITPQFVDKNMIERHRMIYKILHDDMEAQGGGIHALSMATYTPEQWKERQGT